LINRTHSILASLSEIRQVISHFDWDEDGRLSFEEYIFNKVFRFLCFVLTDSQPSLRKLSLDRALFGPKKVEYFLPYDVEYSIVKLLERELDLGKNLQIFLKDLSYRYDFNSYDLFKVLDNFGFGFLTSEKYYII